MKSSIFVRLILVYFLCLSRHLDGEISGFYDINEFYSSVLHNQINYRENRLVAVSGDPDRVLIRRSYIERLPKEPYEYSNIKAVAFVDSSITWSRELVEDLLKLGELQQLIFIAVTFDGDLEMLSEFGASASVAFIQLSGMNLQEVPKWLETFTELRVLNLSMNRITEIPEWFAIMEEIRSVDLAFNDIRGAIDFGFMSNKVQELRFDGNHLDTVSGNPPGTLKRVFLSGNKLQKFRFSRTRFPVLDVLDIGDNYIPRIELDGDLDSDLHLVVSEYMEIGITGTDGWREYLTIERIASD